MSKKTAFIVCDSPMDANKWSALLQSEHYRTIVEHYSGAVIDMLKGEEADLLLIEEVSPSMGPSSFDLIKNIRSEPGLETLPILLLSIEKDPQQFPDAGRTGANVDLVKPVSDEDVLSHVRDLMG